MAAGTRALQRLEVIIGLRDLVSKRLAGLERRFTRFTRGVRRGAARIRAGFIAISAGALGLAAAFGGPVTAFASFEEAMARVGAVSRANTAELRLLTAQSRQLGATTSFTARQVASAQQFLAQAGFGVNKVLASTAATLDLARVGKLELGAAADIASNILSAFGLRAEEMTRVVDVLAAASTRSNVRIRDLGEAMKFAAPVAAQLGVEIEELAALVGKLGDVGLQGSLAGTTLRASMLRLAAPTGEARRALAGLGIVVSDSQGRFRGLTAILEDFERATRPLGQTRRIAMIKQIFGEEAAAGVAALLKQARLGTLRKFTAELKGATGEARRMAGVIGSVLMGRFRTLGSAIESLAITVGKALEPIVRPIINWLIEIVRQMDAWAERFPNVTKALLLLTGVVFALVVAFGLLTVIAGMFAILAAGFALLLLPGVGIVLAVVGAIVGGFLLLGVAIAAAIFWWDELRAAAGVAADWIVGKWDALGDHLVERWEHIVGDLRGKWAAFVDWIIGLWQKVVRMIAPIAGFLGIEIEARQAGGAAAAGTRAEVVPGAAEAISRIANTDNSRRVTIEKVNITTERMDAGVFERVLILHAGG